MAFLTYTIHQRVVFRNSIQLLIWVVPPAPGKTPIYPTLLRLISHEDESCLTYNNFEGTNFFRFIEIHLSIIKRIKDISNPHPKIDLIDFLV